MTTEQPQSPDEESSNCVIKCKPDQQDGVEEMLRDLGLDFRLIGRNERRTFFIYCSTGDYNKIREAGIEISRDTDAVRQL